MLSVLSIASTCFYPLFFLNDPAPTEIYTLSLHDALPIYLQAILAEQGILVAPDTLISYQDAARHIEALGPLLLANTDRKSTRLNSSHVSISYAVFCLKKKKNKIKIDYYIKT